MAFEQYYCAVDAHDLCSAQMIYGYVYSRPYPTPLDTASHTVHECRDPTIRAHYFISLKHVLFQISHDPHHFGIDDNSYSAILYFIHVYNSHKRKHRLE